MNYVIFTELFQLDSKPTLTTKKGILSIHYNKKGNVLTCDLRDLGIQMIALPSREQVTILSWLNLKINNI